MPRSVSKSLHGSNCCRSFPIIRRSIRLSKRRCYSRCPAMPNCRAWSWRCCVWATIGRVSAGWKRAATKTVTAAERCCAVGPPYYSLLRAIDQLGGPGVAPHAFVERAPGVWVELGHAHPLAANIRPPKGKLLLLRPPRNWILLQDAPFRDVYEIVE